MSLRPSRSALPSSPKKDRASSTAGTARQFRPFPVFDERRPTLGRPGRKGGVALGLERGWDGRKAMGDVSHRPERSESAPLCHLRDEASFDALRAWPLQPHVLATNLPNRLRFVIVNSGLSIGSGIELRGDHRPPPFRGKAWNAVCNPGILRASVPACRMAWHRIGRTCSSALSPDPRAAPVKKQPPGGILIGLVEEGP